MAGKISKLFGVGLFLAFFGTHPILGEETPSNSSCSTCKNKKHGASNWRTWLFNQETPQGLSHGGPRHQGTRQKPLYLFFAAPCKEKQGAEKCDNHLSWSPTGWRNFTSTGHRMFDLPTQFGVGSGQD